MACQMAVGAEAVRISTCPFGSPILPSEEILLGWRRVHGESAMEGLLVTCGLTSLLIRNLICHASGTGLRSNLGAAW